MSLRATVFFLISVSLALHITNAKRGCSAFGHSCYGGHGKRSGNSVLGEVDSSLLNSLVPARRQVGQEEVPKHVLYPTGRALQPGDDVIPIRDGGISNHEDNEIMKDFMKYRLRNIFKHWIDSYRRHEQFNSEETPDESM